MGALSAAIMNLRGVPRQQMVAGAAISSMTPGLLAMVIPLAIANQADAQAAAKAASGTATAPASSASASSAPAAGPAIAA